MRDKLEKRIVEKPEDLARHQEYAAWLREQGDPRADFIETQIALENTSLARDRRFELEAIDRRLIQQHGREWIGDLGDFILARGTAERPFELRPGCVIHWWRGWVRGLQLDELTLRLSKVLLQTAPLRLFTKLILTEPVNASCDYLHEWGLLERVKELDLSYGRITDKGAQTLAADKSIRKLHLLDLTGNQLTAEGVAAIRKSFPKVLYEDQNPIEIQRGEAAAARPVPDEVEETDED